MTESKNVNQPTSLEEAKRIVEQEFLGIDGIHGVGKKVSKNAVRVYAAHEDAALDSALAKIKSRCAPYNIDLIIEEKSSSLDTGSEEAIAKQPDVQESE